MEYLDCPCQYLPSMRDDDPISSAYEYAQREGLQQGFVPVLIRVEDALAEWLGMSFGVKDSNVQQNSFTLEKAREERHFMLSRPVPDGEQLLHSLVQAFKAELAEDETPWEEFLGAMEGGYSCDHLSSYWNYSSNMTYPVILAKIPVQEPWQIFAYLPFGGWNHCPNPLELMAVAKYWFQKYGAIPAALCQDALEFQLPSPIPKDAAMQIAVEQYGFCPDMGQNFDHVGKLADTLWQSTVWFFWWD